jgi:hypothetical protein
METATRTYQFQVYYLQGDEEITVDTHVLALRDDVQADRQAREFLAACEKWHPSHGLLVRRSEANQGLHMQDGRA